MEYLIRLVQVHETFRKLELEALAALAKVKLEFFLYHEESPFCIVRLESNAAAKALMERSILSQGIYELWGTGTDYTTLQADVTSRTQHLWPQYTNSSFRFFVEGFHASPTYEEQQAAIKTFTYLNLQGQVRLKDAEVDFRVFEDYDLHAKAPKMIYFGRLVSNSARLAITKFDLKKRKYISTTSMDAELALVTANMAHAAPGKFFCDPFTGTGGFPLACAHFGAMVMGMDIDGRSIRGKPDRNLSHNLVQYGLTSLYLDSIIADVTNSPLRTDRILDGIVCDPPYGVREGLKVLGTNKEWNMEVRIIDGVPAHLREGFVAPKRAYSFEAMLDDILNFGAVRLVDDARLAMWMPSANEDEDPVPIPTHPCLELVSVSVQHFNKWARRLLTYRRLPGVTIDYEAWREERAASIIGGTGGDGKTANELNNFRKKYFEGFRNPPPAAAPGPE